MSDTRSSDPSLPNGGTAHWRPTALARGAALVSFAAIFLAARIPAFLSPQWGEEGMFTHLLLEEPAGPQYLLIARVSGEPVYSAPEHPAPLYLAVELAGRGFRLFFPQWRAQSDYELTGLLRFAFSLVQLALFSAILWIVLRSGRRWAAPSTWIPAVLVGAVAVSPLSIASSTALQIDGAVGALFVGLLPAVLLASHFRPWPRARLLGAIFAASFLTGLGKQEWSMALLAALAASFALGRLLGSARTGTTTRPDGPHALAVALGCLVGNLASFLSDRSNWLGGLRVMTGILSAQGQAQAMPVHVQVEVILERLPFLSIPLLLVLLVAVTLLRRLRERDPWTPFLATYGVLLTAGFMVAWRSSSDPRYFAPAMLVLVCAAILSLDGGTDIWSKSVSLAVLAAIAIPSAYALVNAGSHARIARERFDIVRARIAAVRRVSNCLPVLPSAYAYDPGVEFVAQSIGDDLAQAIASRHGRWLCPY